MGLKSLGAADEDEGHVDVADESWGSRVNLMSQ